MEVDPQIDPPVIKEPNEEEDEENNEVVSRKLKLYFMNLVLDWIWKHLRH